MKSRSAAKGEVERLQQWIDDLLSGMYVNCIYCGHRYGPAETTASAVQEALYAHVRVCPKHPLWKALSTLALVLDQVDYTAGACGPTEMVAAVLPKEVIVLARRVLARGGAP